MWLFECLLKHNLKQHIRNFSSYLFRLRLKAIISPFLYQDRPVKLIFVYTIEISLLYANISFSGGLEKENIVRMAC